MLKVVLTGPECTAKSTLAEQLADHYGTFHVKEYARDYVQSLNRPYDHDDVLHIARKQVQQFNEAEKGKERIVFFDTYLEITLVWFDIVFKAHPGWIDDELSRRNISLYLLCDLDIPWMPDGVRENGGKMRENLFAIYRNVLEQYGFRYRIVSGIGPDRLLSAIDAVDELLDRESVTWDK